MKLSERIFFSLARVKSTVQRASETAEDGEIVSSPELDKDSCVEITLHAEITSDDDSLNGTSPKGLI